MIQTLAATIVTAALTACAHGETPQSSNDITAHISGTAFVTRNLHASVHFYTSLLGYRERGRRVIDSEATTSVFGVPAGTALEYIVLVPAEFSEANPNFPGLNFVGISDAGPIGLSEDPTRAPKAGELVMAFEVTNLDAIYAQIISNNVKVVAPRALSETGKSETITVLDPNGIRVQLYEYVSVEPAE
ncbi:MAG: VOC family protein [Pseudomonadota bacterium]